jgi:glycosidase
VSADAVQLCREAHRRGMRVIVDLVVNHTSAGRPWFLSAPGAVDAPYGDWYE